MMILAAALAASGCAPEDKSEIVVARVDDREITVAEFEETAEMLDNEYLPAAGDMEGKKKLLEHMINKEIMGLKALGMGYDKEEWFVEFWEQFKNPFLITSLMDQMVAKKVEVTEEEIENYWQEMHYEYTLSQILVAEEAEAMEIREKIMAGEDFAEMARMYSLGPAASEGGYVGSNEVGRIHWWVEEELFGMEEGEVSMPLRTSSGYALIKVHRKRKIIPELDREWARKRVRAIKEKQGMDALKAGIEEDINLRFFTDAVDIAYDALPPDIPIEDIINYKVTRENAPKLDIPAQYEDMIIVQYDDGSFTLKDFEEIYEKFALPERPRRAAGREYVVQMMHKVVFDRVLPAYAEQQARVHEIPEVKETLQRRKEQFLVHKLYQDQVKDEVTVTDAEVREYFAEHLDELLTTERRDYSVILVGDEETARDVRDKAMQGANFGMLVRKFSQNENVKENFGRTGLHSEGALPDYDEVAFAFEETGEISEPFETSRGWAVIKLEEIEKGRVPTFDEARQSIRKALLEQKYEEKLKEKIAKWREDYVVEIYEDNLARAELKRTRL